MFEEKLYYNYSKFDMYIKINKIKNINKYKRLLL